jgi:hypothetical protein
MSEQLTSREAILGAATALEGQWSPAWIAALRTAAGERSTSAEGGIDRAEFLKRFPTMADAVDEWEADPRVGTFERTGSVKFKDGRCVFLTRFANTYSLSCHNPKNEEKDKTFEVFMSKEAMMAIIGLYELFGMEGDEAALMANLEPVESVASE